MDRRDDESLIRAERLGTVFQQAHLTLAVTVVNAGLTAIVLSAVVDRARLAIWFGLIIAISAVRWVAVHQFLRRRPVGGSIHFWAMVSVSGSLATGALWGGGALVLLPSSQTYQLFLLFVIAGMCAGTTAVNSAYMPAVAAFILPASLPLGAHFLLDGSAPHLVSALMIFIFAAALCLSSLRAHTAFGERLRLQHALERQRQELSASNERLRYEIAERQNAEARLQHAQKMEAIGHLTGGMAHDFNNLLAAIVVSVDLIGRAVPDDSRVMGYVAAALRAADRGARLTTSLLTFARRQSFRVEQANLNVLLEEFQPILQQAVDTAILFQTNLDPTLPDCNVDTAHFHAAILNLVINARDAMPQGGSILLRTGLAPLQRHDLSGNPDAKPGAFVSISVEDSGVGISKDVLSHVFEPFFTTKKPGKGSGLGLSQVYGFARQSGGHVSIDSTQGVGTRVTLWLPIASRPKTVPKSGSESDSESGPPAGVSRASTPDRQTEDQGNAPRPSPAPGPDKFQT